MYKFSYTVCTFVGHRSEMDRYDYLTYHKAFTLK